MASSTLNLPPLPPGFELEGNNNQDLPPLPPGFELQQPKEQPSRARSLIGAPIKGLLKGAENLNPLAPQSIAQLIAPTRGAENALEQAFPTQKKLPERILERAGKLAPLIALGPEGLPLKAAQLVAATGAGEAAKGLDAGELGQTIAEIAGMTAPGAIQSGIKKTTALLKAPKEKMASGLTKPRAVEAKFPEKGIIQPQRQEKVINQLNEEASKLTRETVEKKLPLTKQIEEGFDFEKQYEEGFGKLKSAAEKANPSIETEPVSKFLSETGSKYRGIPTLHAEAAKIMKEVKNFRTVSPSSLKNLLKIYRSNNKKVSSIFETSRITGKQQEYTDFLLNLNRNIAKSIENTLPKNSAWIKEFKDLNQSFKNFKDSVKTLKTLEPILHQKVTPASLEKFSRDTKLQKKLSLSMGEEGANEVIQIAKDLNSARTAVNKIPARDFKLWEKVVPLSIFVPFGKVFAGVKSVDYAKRLYGYFLSTSSRRKAYSEAIQAIKNNDLKAYEKAANKLFPLGKPKNLTDKEE